MNLWEALSRWCNEPYNDISEDAPNKVSKIKNLLSISVWVALLQLVGFGLGQVTRSNSIWYHSLYKSFLTPKDIVFPIVWTVLYIMLALVGNFLWRYRDEPKAKRIWNLYVIQLLLNWAWTIIFFGCHLIGLAFLLIVAMILINMNIVLKAKKKYYFAANMMIPYILWLAFAGYLSFMLRKLN